MRYDVTVTRDGRWWMIEIPAINGLTQARRLSEVEEMTASLIAVTLDIPLSKVNLGQCTIKVPGVEKDLAATKEAIEHFKEKQRELEAKVSAQMRETATELAQAEVPMRDIGTILGVSHQRASQLVDA